MTKIGSTTVRVNRPLAFFRFRPAFRWTHLIVGAVALKFALAAIYVASGFHNLHLPKYLRFVLLAWLITYVAVHLFLLIHRCVVAKKSGRAGAGSTLKKVVVFPYLAVLWSLALTFVAAIAAAN